jgi:cyclic pyranopterin phosphate synthase
LDTLNADKYIQVCFYVAKGNHKFQQITRRNAFDKVWRAILAAEEAMPKGRVKLNCVLMRGVNDGELIGLVELGRERALDVRFIEFMPFTGNRYEMAKFMPYREMLAKLEEHYGKGEIGKLGQGPHDTSKVF